jgi:L-lysine exporter family protein LysE/ArgO
MQMPTEPQRLLFRRIRTVSRRVSATDIEVAESERIGFLRPAALELAREPAVSYGQEVPPATDLLQAGVAGLGLGFSLIVAIGAQNAFVLRQGIKREHVLPVVLVCALSDAILILAGITGIGFVVERFPVALVVLRWVGAAFLIGYGLLAARRALRPEALVPDAERAPSRLWPTILTVLALTWLNPHVYLDTVLLLGSIASTHGEQGKWAFGAGAVVASIVWFSALGFGARLLRGVFAKPMSWRILDGVIAVVMILLAVLLLVRD